MSMFRRGMNPKRPRFSVGGQSFFEHEDSSNHSGMGLVDYEDDSSSQHHNTSTNSYDSNFAFNQFAPDRPRRAHKLLTKSQTEDNTNLNACLDHLFRTLSRKDKEGFFQFPVTDQIAPGYSTIIAHPMDFSTMKRKITQDDYSNILEFRSDFELMCHNAMKYNRPDTIYWQAAKKLLAFGSKLMHKDKLISSRRNLECFSRLTERELGFRIDSLNHSNDDLSTVSNDQLDFTTNDSESLSSMSIGQVCSQRKPKLILKLPKYYDKLSNPTATTITTTTTAITTAATTTSIVLPTITMSNSSMIIPEEEIDEVEELPPEEILAQAQQAAQLAREKLSLRANSSIYTLEYQHTNSSSSILYVNQDDFSEQIVKMNDTSDAPSLSSLLPIVDENGKRNDLLSKHFLENGPFSSNASQYDSPFGSTPKEELDLLIHTYGSEFSAQYAVSLMDYVKDAGDLALAFVDRFLSVLTNGEHDNFVLKKREKQQPKQEPEEIDEKNHEILSANTLESTDSLLPPSSDQIKLEPQLTTDNHLTNINDSINDFDLFHLNNLSQISDGPESLNENLSLLNANDSTFDTL